MVILFILPTPDNTYDGIIVIPLSNVTFVSESQAQNGPELPHSVRLLGIIILLRLLHPSNEIYPSVLRLSEKVTLVNVTHP